MTDYKDFLLECERIDGLLNKGYRIIRVTENLSGSILDFEIVEANHIERKRVNIKTADARKYFASLMIEQAKGARKATS